VAEDTFQRVRQLLADALQLPEGRVGPDFPLERLFENRPSADNEALPIHLSFLRDLEQEFEEEIDFPGVELDRWLYLLQVGTVQQLIDFINGLETPGKRSKAWQQRVLTQVDCASKLIDFCGCWPSFLDAVLEGLAVAPEGPTVTGRFIITDSDPDMDQLDLNKQATVIVRWSGVQDLSLRALRQVGVGCLCAMRLTFVAGYIESALVFQEELECSIVSTRMEVLEVQPLTVPPGSPT
jgi:hypothetical protein